MGDKKSDLVCFLKDGVEKRVHVKTWLFSKTESLFNPLPGAKENVTFHSCFGAEVASLVTTVSLQDIAYDSDGIDYLRDAAASESACHCPAGIKNRGIALSLAFNSWMKKLWYVTN